MDDPGQLALEQRLLDAAIARAAEGCGRLDGDLAGLPKITSTQAAELAV